MNVIVLGAGVIGVCTAWHLAERGHSVTVVERRQRVAQETSQSNGGQISVSFCEPWASPRAPSKVMRWMWRADAPLLFRPQMDPYQWRWSAAFASQCTQTAFEQNLRHLVALGRYSHQSLQEIVAATGIEFQRLRKGILQFFTEPEEFAAGARSAALMFDQGLERHVLTPKGVVETEPALERMSSSIVGGLYTPSDESGDACLFTQGLQQACAERGVRFLFEHEVEGIEVRDGRACAARLRDKVCDRRELAQADAFVVAMGPWSAPFLRTVGVDHDIYPTKGYSVTLRLLQPERANVVSLIDDERKLAITRLGDYVRVAGTAEMVGYDTSVSSAHARLRCTALVQRFNEIFPGVADTSVPQYWAGLRPSTPSNVPLIGRTRIDRLWLNSGHGTLGWTHAAGSGKVLAMLIDGDQPPIDFPFDRAAQGAWPGSGLAGRGAMEAAR